VFSNGEVAWPADRAREALDALAANGCVILGLDVRTLYANRGVMEVPVSAWSERTGEDRTKQVRRAHEEAVDALSTAAEGGAHVLITWG
jgi:hypothetical protein